MRMVFDEQFMFKVLPVGVSSNGQQHNHKDEQNVEVKTDNKVSFAQLFNEQIGRLQGAGK